MEYLSNAVEWTRRKESEMAVDEKESKISANATSWDNMAAGADNWNSRMIANGGRLFCPMCAKVGTPWSAFNGKFAST